MKVIENIFYAFKKSQGKIKPNFVLAGSTGSGKTHLISECCNQANLKMITVNAATLTKEGISGASLSRVLAPLRELQEQPVVCFVDEFDKQFLSDSSNARDVQDEFLKALESSVTVAGDYGKFHEVDTSKVLWIFAGAFKGKEIKTSQDLNALGIKEEFIGRVPLVYQTKTPTLEDLLIALDSSKLLTEYCQTFKQSRDIAFEHLSHQIQSINDSNTIGYRIINKLIHQYFIEQE